jgi:hypothetical protein
MIKFRFCSKITMKKEEEDLIKELWLTMYTPNFKLN